MKYGSPQQIQTWKAMIMDMNEHELRMTLLVILNGFTIDVAIDQATAIYAEITKAV